MGLLPEHVLRWCHCFGARCSSLQSDSVGTGPYQAESYELHDDGSASVVLSIFPQYYGEVPNIGKIRFVAYATSTALAENRSVWNGAARIRQS